jgi:hypothetical protein
MIATVKFASVTSKAVRLTPFTQIEPFSIISGAKD